MRARLALLGGIVWSVATYAQAVSSSAPDATASAVASDDQHRGLLRRQVLQSLRNPGTARFRNEFLSRGQGPEPVVLCGWVDAEDQGGQRVGFVAFIAADDGPVLYQVSDPYGSFPHLWRARCSHDEPAMESTQATDERIRVGDKPGPADAQTALNR